MFRVLLVLAVLIPWAARPVRAEILIGEYNQAPNAGRVLGFADASNGNAAPIRTLGGPAAGLVSSNGIFYAADENALYIADFWGQAIRVFAANGSGSTAPLRTFNSASLGQVRALAIDPVHDEMIVIGSQCMLCAFPRTSSGTSGFPIRRLSWGGLPGGVTQLNNPYAVVYLAGSDEIAVADGNKLLVFNRTDSGNTAPKRIIAGPATGLGEWIGGLVHDPVTHRLYAAAYATRPDNGRSARVLAHDDQANGDVAPLRIMAGTATGLELGSSALPMGLAIDPPRRRLIVSIGDSQVSANGAVLAFDLEANGNAAPLQVIQGTQTGFGDLGAPAWMPDDRIMANGFESPLGL